MSNKILKIALVPCVTLGLWLGCKTVEPKPVPPSAYHQPEHEITNGVVVVFDSVPSQALTQRLFEAGAQSTMNSEIRVFIFDSINTEAKRLAVNAALLAGATLKGTP